MGTNEALFLEASKCKEIWFALDLINVMSKSEQTRLTFEKDLGMLPHGKQGGVEEKSWNPQQGLIWC